MRPSNAPIEIKTTAADISASITRVNVILKLEIAKQKKINEKFYTIQFFVLYKLKIHLLFILFKFAALSFNLKKNVILTESSHLQCETCLLLKMPIG